MTKCFSHGSIPVFLGDSGTGPTPKIAAQLKFCDVFYTEELIVGFHVVGAMPDTLAGFFVEEPCPTILFLNVAEEDVDPGTIFEGEAGGTIKFFNVSEEPTPEAPSFFEVKDPSQDTILFFNVGEITESELLAFFVNEDP